MMAFVVMLSGARTNDWTADETLGAVALVAYGDKTSVRFVCPYCVAPAGAPCRTRSGKLAEMAHMPRVRLSILELVEEVGSEAPRIARQRLDASQR